MDTELTELTELNAEKVSAVGAPANGTTFLLAKAAAEPSTKDKFAANAKRVKEGKDPHPEPVKAEEEEAEKSDSPEADEQEEEMTGETAKAAESTKDANDLPDSAFAYIEPGGTKDKEGKTTPRDKRHFRIHDAPHVRNALARASQSPHGDKALPKIKAAAKKFGIEVSEKELQKIARSLAITLPKGWVAKCVGPGVPDGALDEPKEGGHLDTGNSGTSGSVTAGPKPSDGNSSLVLGGQSTYVIPDEAKVTDNPPIPPTDDAAGIVNRSGSGAIKGAAVASLVEALDLIEAQRQMVKDGKYLQVENPSGDAANAVGSMPWESYDSATLGQVASCLAGCCRALDAMQQREAVEAASGNPGDYMDARELEEAQCALDYAMGVAARLSFKEGAEGEAVAAKAGRTLSGKNESALRTARDHLNAVLDGAKDKSAGDAGSTEEHEIMTTVTKDELAAMIATGSVQAAKELRKQEKKDRKARKEEAAKNSNPETQGGDISEADIKATSEADANDVNAVPDGGHVDPQYVNKGSEDTDPAVKQLQEQVESLSKQLGDANELLTKIAKRPRTGGPHLTGQGGGLIPAAEGRQGEAAKGAEDGEITALRKAVEDATDPQEKSFRSMELTRRLLTKAHEDGRA